MSGYAGKDPAGRAFRTTVAQRVVLLAMSDGVQRSIPEIAALTGTRVGASITPLANRGYLEPVLSDPPDKWVITGSGRDAVEFLRSIGALPPRSREHARTGR